MTHELQIIEDEVLSALSPLTSQGVRTLEVYNGHLATAEEFDRLIRRFPCLIVATGSLDVETDNRVDLGSVGVHLLVGDRHRRGPTSATRGDTQSPGVLSILKAARDILNGPGVMPLMQQGWSRFRWLGDEMIVEDAKAGVSLWRSTYETKKAIGRN